MKLDGRDADAVSNTNHRLEPCERVVQQIFVPLHLGFRWEDTDNSRATVSKPAQLITSLGGRALVGVGPADGSDQHGADSNESDWNCRTRISLGRPIEHKNISAVLREDVKVGVDGLWLYVRTDRMQPKDVGSHKVCERSCQWKP